MSVTQKHLRAIIFYEWRGGIRATAAARDITSRLGDGTATIRAVQRWFARFTNGDTDFEDKPGSGRPPHSVEDSAILLQSKRIQGSTPAILRRDSDVAIQQSSVASTPSATEKCWLDGLLSP